MRPSACVSDSPSMISNLRVLVQAELANNVRQFGKLCFSTRSVAGIIAGKASVRDRTIRCTPYLRRKDGSRCTGCGRHIRIRLATLPGFARNRLHSIELDLTIVVIVFDVALVFCQRRQAATGWLKQ